MPKKISVLFGIMIILVIAIVVYTHQISAPVQQIQNESTSDGNIISGAFDKSLLKTDAEWKKIVTPEQYTILRQQGTEIPFTGALLHNMQKGTYYSVGCKDRVLGQC